ncbi:hypothetical protein CAPTEDRAFT_209432, partial [Capitella teleta]
GGLLLGIDNRLPSKRRPDLECECEILVCEISGLSRVNIAIILVYRPPSSDCATFTSLLDETLCKVSAEYSNICLLGDFNMPNIDWHALDIVSSTADATFIQMTQSHALDQLNTRASNAQETFLDLLFCNDSTLLCNISHLDDEFNFDEHHRILLFNMLLHIPLLHRQPRRIFNYKRADLTSLCEHLGNVYLNLDFGNVDNLWLSFFNQVNDILNLCIPIVTVKDSHDPVWFDSEARNLVKRKRTLYRKAKRNNTDRLWRRYKDFNNSVKTVLKNKHKKFISSLGNVCTVVGSKSATRGATTGHDKSATTGRRHENSRRRMKTAVEASSNPCDSSHILQVRQLLPL